MNTSIYSHYLHTRTCRSAYRNSPPTHHIPHCHNSAKASHEYRRKSSSYAFPLQHRPYDYPQHCPKHHRHHRRRCQPTETPISCNMMNSDSVMKTVSSFLPFSSYKNNERNRNTISQYYNSLSVISFYQMKNSLGTLLEASFSASPSSSSSSKSSMFKSSSSSSSGISKFSSSSVGSSESLG